MALPLLIDWPRDVLASLPRCNALVLASGTHFLYKALNVEVICHPRGNAQEKNVGKEWHAVKFLQA